MSRTRLTTKTAAEVAINDPYTMNGARPTGNINPAEKYDIGGPSEFGEDPISTADTKKLHDKDVNERNEMNVGDVRLAFDAAVKSASELEGKAVKCLVASQRMLPGANRDVVEAQAIGLMHLPGNEVDMLLGRQESLARSIAASADECADDKATADEEKKAVEAAAPAAPAVAPEAKEDEDKFAKLASQIAALTAKIAEFKPFEKKDEDADDKAPAAVKTASANADGLDSIFRAAVPATGKTGAASLNGLVRTAATSRSNELDGLFESAPDVSSYF